VPANGPLPPPSLLALAFLINRQAFPFRPDPSTSEDHPSSNVLGSPGHVANRFSFSNWLGRASPLFSSEAFRGHFPFSAGGIGRLFSLLRLFQEDFRRRFFFFPPLSIRDRWHFSVSRALPPSLALRIRGRWFFFVSSSPFFKRDHPFPP